MDDRQRRLYAVTDEVLHYLWDPIGIAGVPQARGEYHGYVPQVFGILQRGGDAAEVESYLLALSEGMGLSSGNDRARSAAAVLVEWRTTLAQGTAEHPLGRLR